MPRRRAVKPVTAGSRVGTKRSDMRWRASDGSLWDSRFEYEVFLGLQQAGLNVRRTTDNDSLSYTHKARNGLCTKCGSNCVVTSHSYTADFHVSAAAKEDDESGRAGVEATGYIVEAKGYLRANRRSLLRSFRKARPDVDLRFIVQRDYKVGKSTICGWASKFLKCPCVVWKGTVPHSWGV